MMITRRQVRVRTGQLRRCWRIAALTAATLTAGACCAAAADATVAGHNGPIAYVDKQGDIALVNSNGTGRRVLVPASSLAGYRLEIAGSGAWSSGTDPELLFVAESTAQCIDYPCPPAPAIRLYREPESGGKPKLIADNIGLIQSASWFGTSTHEIVVSADNGSTDKGGDAVFGLDMFSLTAPGYLYLPVQGFDVDATDSEGYIEYAHGNESYAPTGASPDGPWEGCKTNFSTGLRQCTYQSGPTPPCGGPGYGITPCPSAPSATVDYSLQTGIYLDMPAAKPITYVAPMTSWLDYGLTVDPANNHETYVAELGTSPPGKWLSDFTYDTSRLINVHSSSAPSVRWAWSPNGAEIAQSRGGTLSVYNAGDLASGPHVIASDVAPAPGFYLSLRNAGSVIAWASPQPAPLVPMGGKGPGRKRAKPVRQRSSRGGRQRTSRAAV